MNRGKKKKSLSLFICALCAHSVQHKQRPYAHIRRSIEYFPPLQIFFVLRQGKRRSLGFGSLVLKYARPAERNWVCCSKNSFPFYFNVFTNKEKKKDKQSLCEHYYVFQMLMLCVCAQFGRQCACFK